MRGRGGAQGHSERTAALQGAVQAAQQEASDASAAAAAASSSTTAHAARAAELQACCERQQVHLQVASLLSRHRSTASLHLAAPCSRSSAEEAAVAGLCRPIRRGGAL